MHRQAVECLRSTRHVGETRPTVDGRQTTGCYGWCGLQSERAQRALDQLTDVEREMLVLAYYEGMTVSELAVRFDQKHHAVTATLHVGLRRLRDELAKETLPSEVHGGRSSLRPGLRPQPELPILPGREEESAPPDRLP